MFNKICKDTFSFNKVKESEIKKVLADDKIVGNLTKLADSLKRISPKSDDFLYFSIVFLKSAESSLIDEDGLPKKLANGDAAWGYFDDNWKWHGNVQPHKNNNNDIFPECQLKKATSKWVGLPLCKDHQSSSVDGIRGIILDTHYDEKFKQVVGLCALDKINYPDLARKVQTGIVRYGSMGTAVENSVCSTCGNIAKTADQYCDHVRNRSAWGEINVGLKPIEYSLVVQPAEPQAILLKCIASLNNYKQEFINNGIDDVNTMLGKLSLNQAQHLDGIMKTACGKDGCSLEKRNKIITSFFNSNKNLIKKSENENIELTTESDEVRNYMESSRIARDNGDFELSKNLQNKARELISDKRNDSINYKPEDLEEANLTYSNPMNGMVSNTEFVDTENSTLDESNQDDLLGYVNVDNNTELTSLASENNIKSSIKTLLEDYMNKSRLKKRAELRRKMAYYQGGAEGVEPPDFKKIEEDAKKYWDEDKQMKQTDANFNDVPEKEKLSRADLQERAMKRMAYYQGGSEGVEPKTYKDEGAANNNIRNNEDKQMKQTGNMGGTTGLFPGDAQTKEMLKRAEKYRGLTKSSAYSGPGLKTKLAYAKTEGGDLDKGSTRFEVFAGEEKVISVTASDIFGSKVERNWGWLKSQDYGKRICKYVRAHGLEDTILLLKNAQEEAPAEVPAEMPAEMPMEMEPEMPAAEEMAPVMEEEIAVEEVEEVEEDASTAVEGRLSEMESLIDDIRSLIEKLKTEGTDVDINVDVGGANKEDVEELDALARGVLVHLKKVAVEIDESADEIAMISETYDNLSKISSSDRKRFQKLANEAVKDSDEIIGEARASVRLAKTIIPTLEKRAMEDVTVLDEIEVPVNDLEDNYDASLGFAEDDGAADSDHSDLIAEAILLRKNKREQLLKQAEQKIEEVKSEKTIEKEASLDEVKKEAEETSMDRIKSKLTQSISEKTATEDKERFKVKLRRAYDVAIDMQKKGLIAGTKTALDRQVDEIIQFDNRAFESFKRSIANMKPVANIKVASNLGGINVGINEEPQQTKSMKVNANVLSSLWDK